MRVSKRCRFSIGSLLLAVFVVAISLALIVQHWRHHEALVRRDVEIARLRDRLSETQQMLREIPVSNPQRAYVLAMPSFAYARWVWRVYLPSNSHYALRVNVGHVVENGRIRQVAADPGHSQQMGVPGGGETVVIVERFTTNNRRLLGVSVGRQAVCCSLTPDVRRCMAERTPYQEEQMGSGGVEQIAKDDRIDLLMRWYPQVVSSTPGQANNGPVGFSVWLEPF